MGRSRNKFNVSDLRKIAAGTALRQLEVAGRKERSVFNARRQTGQSRCRAKCRKKALIVADFESDKYRTEKEEEREIESVAPVWI